MGIRFMTGNLGQTLEITSYMYLLSTAGVEPSSSQHPCMPLHKGICAGIYYTKHYVDTIWEKQLHCMVEQI